MLVSSFSIGLAIGLKPNLFSAHFSAVEQPVSNSRTAPQFVEATPPCWPPSWPPTPTPNSAGGSAGHPRTAARRCSSARLWKPLAWLACQITPGCGRLDAQYGGGVSYLMNHHPVADPRRSRNAMSSMSKFMPIASFVTSWTNKRSPLFKYGCRKSVSFFALP